MATPTKTADISLLSLQTVAAGAVAISNAADVATKFFANVFIHLGRTVVTALTNGTIIRIEASSKASGNGHWYPLAQLSSDIATAEAELLTGTVAAGQNVPTMASTTNLVAGDIIYIRNTTEANSEFHRIKSVSANVSVTLEDNLVNAQTGSTVYDQANMWAVPVDLSAVTRLRLVVDNTPTGTQTVAVEAHMVTMDSVG